MNVKFWRSTIVLYINNRYKNSVTKYFLTRKDAKKYQDKHKKTNASWVDEREYYEYLIHECSFQEMKDDMSVTEFEEMFGVKLELLGNGVTLNGR